jgi:2-polyprenyl-6-hydroxyphenyl methylase/3-demethylubiquinone-9 3-methyltransferase
MTGKDLLRAESHFEFGKNWSDYSRLIDQFAVQEAEKGILALIPAEAIRGAAWLDIGSGSGIHSLAAARLGAAEVTAVDIDADSVATTTRVLAENGVQARTERRSVFELDRLGEFDIVYSWGVLHHTGAMWRAVRCAAERVKPGGILAIALYQKTPLCGAWTREKELYTAAPEPVRMAVRAVYVAAYCINALARGQNPFRHIRDYKSSRGMSFLHDVHDWLGGFPYESATPEETDTFVRALGFERLSVREGRPGRGYLGTGCAEYVYRKNPPVSSGARGRPRGESEDVGRRAGQPIS